MAKIKDIDKAMEDVIGASNVKQDKEEEKLFNTTLRNIPTSWRKVLKAEGFTVTGYAKQAIRRALIADGLLKP